MDITTKASRDGEHDRYVEWYDQSELKRQNLAALDELITEERARQEDEEVKQVLGVNRETETSFFKGLMTLFRYRSSKNFRDPEFIGQRFGDKIIVGLLIMSLYWYASGC